MRRKIRDQIKTEKGHRLPVETTYLVTPEVLQCESLGVAIGYPLADLCNVVEGPKDVEISFGESGLCVIPNRAFADEAEKAAFLEGLRGR